MTILSAAIRVGPYTYAVLARPDDDGPTIWGRIRYKERTLRVDPSMAPQMVRMALLHELTHAVEDLGGFCEDKRWPKDEEHHTTTITPL